jgi:hypothetical protein
MGIEALPLLHNEGHECHPVPLGADQALDQTVGVLAVYYVGDFLKQNQTDERRRHVLRPDDLTRQGLEGSPRRETDLARSIR